MDALYARQSVDRDESLSIEGQLARCRFEAGQNECREYVDRGFSGKDTNRPAFQRLMQDVRAGLVRKVIVYRLDRISRSILDFAQMMEVFGENQVEFLSSTEHFDTSAPMGRAMLNICIVFAQLERETIQRRVLDAYADRSRRGFFMGGRAPYGFRLAGAQVGGIHTAAYAPVPGEAAQVALLYRLYAEPSMTLGALARTLREQGAAHLRGGTWNATRLREMLQNPAYCRADASVRDFFLAQGAQAEGAPQAYDGVHGCYLFSGEGGDKRVSLRGARLVPAPHEGLVAAPVWLACRRKLLENRQAAPPHSAKNSWLAGKAKCAKCGYALTVAKSKSAAGRYFLCSGKLNLGCCDGLPTIYAAQLEDAVRVQVLSRLQEAFPLLPACGAADGPRAQALRAECAALGQALENLADKAAQAAPALMAVLNRRADEVAARRDAAAAQLRALSDAAAPQSVPPGGYAARWDALPTGGRQRILDALAASVRVGDGTVEILWRF